MELYSLRLFASLVLSVAMLALVGNMMKRRALLKSFYTVHRLCVRSLGMLWVWDKINIPNGGTPIAIPMQDRSIQRPLRQPTLIFITI